MLRSSFVRAGLSLAPLLAACSLATLLAACEADDDARLAGSSEAGTETVPASPRLDAGSLLDARIPPSSAPADEEYVSTGLKITDAAIAAIAALDPAALSNQEVRCKGPATSLGIGLSCTPRGGQCPTGLSCTANFRGDGGICTKLGCGNTPGTCGGGASCCTLLQAGGASLCFPNDCLPSTCLEAFQ